MVYIVGVMLATEYCLLHGPFDDQEKSKDN